MNDLKCFKCGTTSGKIITHHVSYNPEKIVDCCQSCHVKIHIRIRKENKCPLSLKETDRISIKLNTKRRNARLEHIDFYTTIGKRIGLLEIIEYDPKTGRVGFYSFFRLYEGATKLYLPKLNLV